LSKDPDYVHSLYFPCLDFGEVAFEDVWIFVKSDGSYEYNIMSEPGYTSFFDVSKINKARSNFAKSVPGLLKARGWI
jgi:hypothetical protein